MPSYQFLEMVYESNMKKIETGFSLADSTYEFCEANVDMLNISINSWDQKIIVVSFKNIILFNFKLGSIVSGIYENTERSELLNEALKLYYENIPEDFPFKEFLILDIDDKPIFQVIAENINVIRKTNST